VNPDLDTLFSLEGRVAIVTGGGGTLGSALALGLARVGAHVGILGRGLERATQTADRIRSGGGQALALAADVLDRVQLETARDDVLRHWDRIDILVNAAGGNRAGATLPAGGTFADLPEDAFRQIVDLNLVGTLLPSQVFAAAMVARAEPTGCIVNISSMTVPRAVTRVAGYSAAKAAVENLTRWLAVELAGRYGEGLRVNAIAPGFFVADQNRALLQQADGDLTERGRAIVAHTPAGRFGRPEELVGALVWLCGPGATFVNGIVVPVDGGFGAYSGV
jgi:NAD(P)-dependent dehydrogenase (short-subunit alcohol dehydrogenase family)